MAKVVSCREIGVDCDFVARAETEKELLEKCADHARTAHSMQEITPELAAKVRASIRTE